jgi:thermitase
MKARLAIILIVALFFVGQGVTSALLVRAGQETLPPGEAISLDQPLSQPVTLQEALTPREEYETEVPYVPNDSYFDKQWAFGEIPALPVTTDSPEVLIAILDTGIDQQHEDLAGKVVDSVNFSDSPTSADLNGHGTHVAGIIAAVTDNDIGIAGVAPNARLLNVKVADDNGLVWSSTVAKAIVWAVDNGAKIINMSLVLPTSSPELEQAIHYAWSRGVVLVAGAGNGIKSIPMYPAYYSEVIAVAATDIDGNLWSKSNYGDWVDAYAPGVEIYSTLPGNNYGYQSGTSMATAYVSAVAASAYATVTDTNGDGLVNDEVVALVTTLFAMPEYSSQ